MSGQAIATAIANNWLEDLQVMHRSGTDVNIEMEVAGIAASGCAHAYRLGFLELGAWLFNQGTDATLGRDRWLVDALSLSAEIYNVAAVKNLASHPCMRRAYIEEAIVDMERRKRSELTDMREMEEDPEEIVEMEANYNMILGVLNNL